MSEPDNWIYCDSTGVYEVGDNDYAESGDSFRCILGVAASVTCVAAFVAVLFAILLG